MSNVDDTPIELVHWDDSPAIRTRVIHVLRNEGFCLLGEVRSLTKSDVLGFPNAGKKVWQAIESVIAANPPIVPIAPPIVPPILAILWSQLSWEKQAAFLTLLRS